MFNFAVAADDANLYVYMHSVDAKIVTESTEKISGTKIPWNSTLIFRETLRPPPQAGNFPDKYQSGKHRQEQRRTDGNRNQFGNRQGYRICIRNRRRLGLEAAVPLGSFKPEHGKTVGFQAQANGTTTKDRDSKLIWSKADKADASYNKPNVFGKAVFFKVGSTDVPKAQ